MLLAPEDLRVYDEYDIRLQRFPYPPYLEDRYLFALQIWLPVSIMLSFIYPALNITKSVVYEKEKKLKVRSKKSQTNSEAGDSKVSIFETFASFFQESMKMMGLPNYLHWLAWFIKAFTFLLIFIIIMTVLIKVRLNSSMALDTPIR